MNEINDLEQRNSELYKKLDDLGKIKKRLKRSGKIRIVLIIICEIICIKTQIIPIASFFENMIIYISSSIIAMIGCASITAIIYNIISHAIIGESSMSLEEKEKLYSQIIEKNQEMINELEQAKIKEKDIIPFEKNINHIDEETEKEKQKRKSLVLKKKENVK